MIDKRACDGFYETRLADHLRANGVERVVVTGYATEACVDTTVRRAVSEGFDVVLVEDAHTTGAWAKAADPATVVAHHNRTLGQLVHPDRSVHVLAAEDVQF